MFQLELKDSYSTLHLDLPKYASLGVEERIKIIELTMDTLHSYTNKGFLNRIDLYSFPLVAELLPSLIIDGEDSWEFFNGGKSMECYKWIYNIVILSLYHLCLDTLQSTHGKLDENHDLKLELLRMEKDLYARLDPSIRHRLVKRGVSIKQNIYIGFDTEFNQSSKDENTLVSAQLAVNTRTYIQIPLNKPYKLSSLDDTNKVVPIVRTSTGLNYKKIEASIQHAVGEIRRIKYEENDVCMTILSECLRLVKGLCHQESDEWVVFSLPRSIVQPFIHFGKSFSLKELLKNASLIANPSLTTNRQSLLELIKTISLENFSMKEGKDRLIESILKKFNNYDSIERLGVTTSIGEELPFLPLIESTNIGSEADGESDSDSGVAALDEKSLSREHRDDLFPQRVSVTTTKTYWLIAHLTPADISLLSDFNKLKDELSIVNGSFVTLGKPLKAYGRNLHIRDTMLLAPGTSKSLASVGKLYGGVLQKISISPSDLNNMQGFLERDRAKFIDYALRDALISLIHAS